MKPAKGIYEKWLASAEAIRYAGMIVAFLDGKIFAAADSSGELMNKIEGHPREDEMSIAKGPPPPSSPVDL